MRTVSRRHERGLALAELTVCIFVVAAAGSLLVLLLLTARRVARLESERCLACAIAQGTLEKLRGVPPKELPGAEGRDVPAPPEGRILKNVRVRAVARPWRRERGARHLQVVVTWECRGRQRRATRQGLVSDARLR